MWFYAILPIGGWLKCYLPESQLVNLYWTNQTLVCHCDHLHNIIAVSYNPTHSVYLWLADYWLQPNDCLPNYMESFSMLVPEMSEYSAGLLGQMIPKIFCNDGIWTLDWWMKAVIRLPDKKIKLGPFDGDPDANLKTQWRSINICNLCWFLKLRG